MQEIKKGNWWQRKTKEQKTSFVFTAIIFIIALAGFIVLMNARAFVSKEICDSFITSVGTSSDQTLSYLDLSKMNDYYTKFEAMSAAINSTVKSNYNAFKTLLNSVKSFADDSSWYGTISGIQSYGTIDGYDFLNKLGNNSKYTSFIEQINEVKAAYKELVAYSKIGTGAGNANGLIVIAGTYISYPSSETAFNNWRSLF